MDIEILWSLISNVVGGSDYAVPSLLLLIIVYLVYDLIKVKRELLEARDYSEDLRDELTKNIENLRNAQLVKSEKLLESYHNALTTQNERLARLTDMTKTMITLISVNTRYEKNSQKD